MPLPAFLAALGSMAAKVGKGAVKAGKMANTGMKTATPFINAIGGMMGGGQPQPQFGGQQIMGASAPMAIAGLSSAAPVSPHIQAPDLLNPDPGMMHDSKSIQRMQLLEAMRRQGLA